MAYTNQPPYLTLLANWMVGSLQLQASCCFWRTSKCWVAWPRVSVARQSPPARYSCSKTLYTLHTSRKCARNTLQVWNRLIFWFVFLSQFIDPSGCSLAIQLSCQWSILLGDPQQSASLPQPAGWCAPHALWGQKHFFNVMSYYVYQCEERARDVNLG